MRLVCEETRSEPVRGVADENLARLRRLLEPRRDVHGVAEHAKLALLVADRPRDGEAVFDPDPQRQVATRALGDAFVLASSAPRMARRRRSARAGWSSSSWTAPNTATTASPMYFSMRPPDALISTAIASHAARMFSWSSSGSRRSRGR